MSLRQLNSYKFTEQFIDDGVQWLSNNILPRSVQYDCQQRAFKKRYDGFSVSEKGALVYKMGERTLTVVPRERIDSVLADEYAPFGDIGRDRFFGYLARKYVGLSRRRVYAFLSQQPVHQQQRKMKRQKLSKPILASRPLERWQVDLVNMAKYKSPQNRHYAYWLTCIDCFSKYAWVVPIRNKRDGTVADAMEAVLSEAGETPHLIQTDRGSEFQSVFDALLARYGVKHVKSMPYSPHVNGQIERFHGTLKPMVRGYMARNDTRTYIDVLPSLVGKYNEVPHTTTKWAPVDLHYAEYEDIVAASEYMRSRATTRLAKAALSYKEIVVGNSVRVAQRESTADAYTWSSEIFTVIQILKPLQKWNTNVYVLSDYSRVTRDKLQLVV